MPLLLFCLFVVVSCLLHFIAIVSLILLMRGNPLYSLTKLAPCFHIYGLLWLRLTMTIKIAFLVCPAFVSFVIARMRSIRGNLYFQNLDCRHELYLTCQNCGNLFFFGIYSIIHFNCFVCFLSFLCFHIYGLLWLRLTMIGGVDSEIFLEF